MSRICKVRKKTIAKIFYIALILRIFLLILIILLDTKMESGFIGSTVYFDDVRYEMGGEYYANNANNIFDIETFKDAYASVGDWVGYKLTTPFTSTPLWYWIVCILMYITKTKWSIRLFNVVIASIAIIYVYKFTRLVYGEKTATRTSYLLALLPYPALFSCFAYKDHLVMLCTFFLLYKAASYRCLNKINVYEIISIGFVTLVLSLMRSGLTVLLLLLCVGIAFSKNIVFTQKYSKKTLILFMVALILVGIFLYKYYGNIIYKLQYYLTRHEETLNETSIAFLTISNFSDLYKLPFTYMFSAIMPIGLRNDLNSWYGVTSNLNIFMTPIAIGSTLYLIKRKPDRMIFWSCFAFYVISIITSLSIFRHYYSLTPLILISFSDFTVNSSKSEIGIIVLGTALFSFSLLTYYLI